MNESEGEKLKNLIAKYNDVLLRTMTNAVAEDLLHLIIVNGDDTDFDLKDFINQREQFKTFVVREFLKHNSSSVTSDLKNMSEKSDFEGRKTKKQTKLSIWIVACCKMCSIDSYSTQSTFDSIE